MRSFSVIQIVIEGCDQHGTGPVGLPVSWVHHPHTGRPSCVPGPGSEDGRDDGHPAGSGSTKDLVWTRR